VLVHHPTDVTLVVIGNKHRPLLSTASVRGLLAMLPPSEVAARGRNRCPRIVAPVASCCRIVTSLRIRGTQRGQVERHQTTKVEQSGKTQSWLTYNFDLRRRQFRHPHPKRQRQPIWPSHHVTRLLMHMVQANHWKA